MVGPPQHLNKTPSRAGQQGQAGSLMAEVLRPGTRGEERKADCTSLAMQRTLRPRVAGMVYASVDVGLYPRLEEGASELSGSVK